PSWWCRCATSSAKRWTWIRFPPRSPSRGRARHGPRPVRRARAMRQKKAVEKPAVVVEEWAAVAARAAESRATTNPPTRAERWQNRSALEFHHRHEATVDHPLAIERHRVVLRVHPRVFHHLLHAGIAR